MIARPRRRTVLSIAVLGALALAACSSSTSQSSATTAATPTTTGGSTTTGAAPATAPAATTTPADTVQPATNSTSTGNSTGTVAARSCTPPDTTTPVQAKAEDTTGQEWDITSFDGTVIRAHWFPLPGLAAGAKAPTVMMGPGWGSAGDTNVNETGFLGAGSISTLRSAGFSVLTWDPRGFGKSTGTVTVDSAQYEARDVQQLIDWLATQPQVELDGNRDPRLGMFGASYGGGIQLVTAAIDCRIDAIVPVIAWNSLQTSLFKADTYKSGWANLLAAGSLGHTVDPTITRANAAGNANGIVAPADIQWFADRGPGQSVAKIAVPTLIIQGTVDTLFTLDEGVDNYEILRQQNVPTAMQWFCGGHGACLTNPGDESRPDVAAVNWLKRYVAGDANAPVDPVFEFVDQDGVSYTADAFPTSTTSLSADGSGTLQLIPDGGAGPAVIGTKSSALGSLVSIITPGKASNAVNVTVPAPAADTVLVGAPQLTITYSGTVPAGDRPTRVFAQLVDDATGIVLGNQITPIDVTLDGQPHTTTVPLEMIAFTAHPGSTVTLQLVATTVAYAQPRLGGSVDFQKIAIDLPVVEGVTKAG